MAHYCKWDFVTDSFKQNPREIKESWAGFPFQGCDACMVFPAGVGPRYTKNQAYMFSGDEYCKWDLSKDAISQRPRKIADGFSSYPFAGVDAVLVFPAGVGPGFTVNMAYMFYGDSYCKWDLERDCLANGPRQIKVGFKCYPFERCDGVMVFPAGVGPEYAENQAYMFCGDEYCKWGLKTDTLSQQPRKIADGFPGFPFPRVGGVLAFPAAVAPSYARNVAYVFERGPDRAPLPRNVAACAGSPALQAPAHMSRTSMSSEEAQAVGEQLYPLVQKLNAEQAGKITGMLLELGRAQVDALLGCPASLPTWVQEAEGVLLRAERETNRRQRDTAQGLRTTQQPPEPEIAPAVVSPASSWSSASSSPAPSSSSLTAKPSPLPPSTLMILGAEKALFRALKAKENPPKFGMIDADAGARPKGRISRVLAAKQVLLGGQAEAEDREGEAGARAGGGGGGGASAEIARGRGEGHTHGEEEERVEKDEAAGEESAGGKEETGEEESGVAVCVEELESGVLALE